MPVPDDIAALVASRHNGTLATLRRDGRPQLSVVTYAWYPDDDGRAVVRVSTVDGRAKVANLRRDARASVLVTDASGWSYAVLDGTVELSPVAQAPDDETVEELIRLYRDANGEHPDWADYRRAMVDDHRLVARLVVEHAYGLVRS
jgi:PPOX class probable F420-dependent enzyme